MDNNKIDIDLGGATGTGAGMGAGTGAGAGDGLKQVPSSSPIPSAITPTSIPIQTPTPSAPPMQSPSMAVPSASVPPTLTPTQSPTPPPTLSSPAPTFQSQPQPQPEPQAKSNVIYFSKDKDDVVPESPSKLTSNVAPASLYTPKPEPASASVLTPTPTPAPVAPSMPTPTTQIVPPTPEPSIPKTPPAPLFSFSNPAPAPTSVPSSAPMPTSNPNPATYQNPITQTPPTQTPPPSSTTDQTVTPHSFTPSTPPPSFIPKNPPVSMQESATVSLHPENVANVANKKSSGFKQFIILLLILIIILAGGAAAYAYIKKIGPFSPTSYSEDNFSSGLLAKISQIDSASYTFSGALNVVSRDKDAVPFVLKISDEKLKEQKQKYYYDSERIKSVQSIISKLNSDVGYYSYSRTTKDSLKKTPKPYASDLESLFPKTDSVNYSLVDPETATRYDYKVTEDGKNFNLTVNFTTDDAINALKSYGYIATSTIIEGKKVTFTKDSPTFIMFDGQPPKPFFTEMSDSLSMLPPEVNAKIAFSASTEFKSQQSANWSFNLDAQGDFGDLTYKINADALRKDNNYYFKINNIPSFFLFDQLATLKGKWVMVPSKATTTLNTSIASSSTSTTSTFTDNNSEFSYIQTGISDGEAKLKENREKFVNFVRKVATIADEEKIFVFKNKPSAENVDGRQLVKYELGFRKDKILSFFTKIQNEAKKDPSLSAYSSPIDQYLTYIKSDEFNQIFDYADKNNSFIIWADDQGFPAIVQNIIRVVPPENAEQLKDKQINITFKLNISNINKPIDIKTPTDATPIDKISSDLKNSGGLSGGGSVKGQVAVMQANLSNLRVQAEIVFDKNNSYGKKPFAIGPCQKATSTLFGDEQFFKILSDATKNNFASTTCVSTEKSGVVNAWAVSVPVPGDDGFSWCVDSKGASKRIIDSLKGDSCK